MKIAQCLILAGIAGNLAAATPVEIHFTGDSTLHAFQGAVSDCDISRIIAPDGTAKMHVDVPVFSLDTEHEGRDKKMFAMFEANTDSMIRGEADWREVLDESQVDIPLTMAIHNETHTIRARRIDGSTNAVHLAFDISLARFGLEPPSVLGIIKVSDTVHVVVDIQREALAVWEQNRQPETEIH